MPCEPGRTVPGYVPFPFYLAYATALLNREGIDAILVDAIAEGLDDQEFIQRIVEYSPDLIVLETSTPSINPDIALSERIYQAYPAPQAYAGPHATYFASEMLKQHNWLKFVLLGEYEYTLLELAKKLTTAKDYSRINGLAYREEDGKPMINPRRELIQDLDDLPYPARDQLPMENYRDEFAELPNPALQIWASRGCPFSCIFCLWPSVMYGKAHYRTRNPVEVAKEVQYCIERYPVRSIFFDDDTFNIGKERILTLCREFKARDVKLPWAVMARADTSDYQTLEAMCDAGLKAIKFGVESASQDILERSGKNLNLQKVRQTVEMTKQLGIKVHLTFTFGLPGETLETIKKTVDLALQLQPDTVQFSLTIPFPGTPYYNQAKADGLLLASCWEDFDGSNRAAVRTEKLSGDQLEQALEDAYRRFNRAALRRKIMANKWHYIRKALFNPLRAIRFLLDN